MVIPRILSDQLLEKWAKTAPHDERVWVGNGISLADIKASVTEILNRKTTLSLEKQ